MIPLRLTIKNFLSYGPQTQTINFEPYHLICLSGKNGHGKSALLDAITWGLWGNARKTGGTAKADEGLLRLGQTSMAVSLDFKSKGQTYRVRREFSYTAGKAYTHLDFGVVDPETHFFRPLTDKTIRETQNKIDSAIGLNYESFINSVFLRQGQSNEFSKKSAKERKEILLTILGLTHYEKVRKRALEKIRAIAQDKEHFTKIHEKLREELATHTTIEEQSILTQHALQKIHEEESILTTRKEALEITLKKILEMQATGIMLREHYTQLLEKQAALITAFTTTATQWRAVHAQQLRAQTTTLHDEERLLEEEYARIENNYTELLALKEQLFACKEQEQKITNDIHAEHVQKKQLLQQACHIHEVCIHGLKTTRAQQEKELTTIREQLAKNNHEQTQLTNVHTEHQKMSVAIAAHDKTFERKKAFYHKFIAMGNTLKTELKDTGTKKSLTNDSTNPCCPLCEQNLSTSRKKFLHTKFVDREHFINHQLTRLTRVIKTLKEQLIADHAHAETLKRQFEHYTAQVTQRVRLIEEHTTLDTQLRIKEHEYAKTLGAIESESVLLKTQELALNTSETDYLKTLTEDSALAAVRATMAGYELRIQEIPMLVQQRITLNQKREALRVERDALIALHKESALQQQRKETVSAIRKEIKELHASQTQVEEKLAAYATCDAQKIELEEALVTLKKTMLELLKNKEELLVKQGSLEQQLHTLTQKNNEFKEQQKKLSDVDILLYEYQAVEHALSKDGIQALLIENALPEIESEANYLLSKLTDNQAHLSLESLRDLKSGGAKETLDIKISDAMGIRPYELFSGGEAFRIDFALRIALSKLLARRSGTSLQSLIIDEGFGSQDEEGLSHIMDALYKIQEDFAKIIIVSHLPSMKDQFPTHFVVNKGPHGSSITIIEQD